MIRSTRNTPGDADVGKNIGTDTVNDILNTYQPTARPDGSSIAAVPYLVLIVLYVCTTGNQQ